MLLDAAHDIDPSRGHWLSFPWRNSSAHACRKSKEKLYFEPQCPFSFNIGVTVEPAELIREPTAHFLNRDWIAGNRADRSREFPGQYRSTQIPKSNFCAAHE
jgi:hypothetical protein